MIQSHSFDMSIPDPRIVETEQEARQWVEYFDRSRREYNGGALGLDTETTGLSIHRDVVLLFSVSDGNTRLCAEAKFLPIFKEYLFENPSVDLDLTNAKFDAHMLYNTGVDISKAGTWRDTTHMSWLWDENRRGRHGLKECVQDFIGRRTPEFTETFGRIPQARVNQPRITVGDLIRQALADPERRFKAMDYASLDAYNSTIMRAIFDNLLDKENLPDGSIWSRNLRDFFYKYEAPFTKVLWKMERRGITVDGGLLELLKDPMKKEMDEIETEFSQVARAVVNLNSPIQLRGFFYGILKKPVTQLTDGGKTGNRQPSTDSDTLDEWAGQGDKYAQLLLRHRSISKIYGTYVTGLSEWIDARSRIHTTFNQHGAVTGRLSSSDPNLQNIPRPSEDKFRIRDAFIHGANKVLVVADYEQLEMRVMAHFSNDGKMIDAINTGIDLHCLTVSEMYGIPYDDVKAAKKAEDKHKENQANPFTERQQWLVNYRQAAKACVHPDTLTTINGETSALYTRVKEITGCDPKAGLIIPLQGVRVQNGRGEDISALYAYPLIEKEGVHVVTRRGVLTCSNDHRFKLADGRLVAAGQLQKGDELPETSVPILQDRNYMDLKYKLLKGTPPVHIELNHEVSYFAGVFAGDGYQSGEHSMGIAHGPVDGFDELGVSYAEWQNIIIDAATKIGLNAIPKARKVYLGSRQTQRYFNALGLMNGNQKLLRVPDWVLRSGKVAILNFLGGLIDTDGTVDRDSGGLSLTTKDPIFAGQVCVAIRSCGLQVAMEPGWNKTYGRYYYRVHIPTADAIHVKSFMRHPGKVARIRDGVKSLTQQPNVVMLVEQAGKIPCLDLTVGAEDHLYLTNGLLTHNTGFGIIYGIGGPGLAAQLTKTLKRFVSPEEGSQLINKWLNVFPCVREYAEAANTAIRSDGCVRTIMDRPRRFGDVSRMSRADQAMSERQAGNARVQGTAADMTKLAMIIAEYDPELNACGAELLLQVHDELVFECPDEPEIVSRVEKRVGEIMSEPFGFPLAVPTPAKAGHGHSWSSAK